jgi:hypothetical protein
MDDKGCPITSAAMPLLKPIPIESAIAFLNTGRTRGI